MDSEAIKQLWRDDRIKDQWNVIPSRLRRRWRKLTDEDVQAPAGSVEYLAERLQRRYGVDRHEAMLQVYEFESEL
ncbi:MAG TPA: CsbD family protein [Rhodanobacteraceae bacterium]